MNPDRSTNRVPHTVFSNSIHNRINVITCSLNDLKDHRDADIARASDRAREVIIHAG